MSPYTSVFLLLLSCAVIYADFIPYEPNPPFNPNLPYDPNPPYNPNHHPFRPNPPPFNPNPPPHHPIPIPNRPLKVKPGKCQPPDAMCRFVRPQGQCKDDGDCDGNEKCCTTYCVPQCLPPMPTRPVRPQPPITEKACPRIPRIACLTPGLKSDCRTDRGCPQGQKCCDTPCNKICMKL